MAPRLVKLSFGKPCTLREVPSPVVVLDVLGASVFEAQTRWSLYRERGANLCRPQEFSEECTSLRRCRMPIDVSTRVQRGSFDVRRILMIK